MNAKQQCMIWNAASDDTRDEIDELFRTTSSEIERCGRHHDLWLRAVNEAAENRKNPDAQYLAKGWLADEAHRKIRKDDPRSEGRMGACVAIGGSMFILGFYNVADCLRNGLHWSLLLMPVGAFILWRGIKFWG